MKKLMGLAVTAAMLFPAQASAEILKNLKVDGSLDIQATAARNAADFTTRGDIDGSGAAANNTRPLTTGDGYRGNDRIGSTVTRLLLNAKWDLLDDTHATVTLRKNDRAWGGTGAGGQGAGGNQSLVGAPGANADVASNLYLQQANVMVDKVGGHVDLTVGRQYYGDMGDLVIFFGEKDAYGLPVTAIDAARFEVANDWMAFSGLAGKAAGGTFGPQTADTNVRGFDILWKNLPVKAHTFVWNRVTQGAGQLGAPPTNASAVTGLNDNLWVYGVKLRGEAMGGWLGVDLAANSGEDRTTTAGTGCTAAGCVANTANYTGKAFLLDGGYNAELGGLGALTPWINFGWGTGRSSTLESRNEGFTSIASDYRPGIMNRRFNGAAVTNLGAGLPGGAGIGTNGLNNRVVYGVGVNMTPTAWEKLTVGAQWWSYNLQRVTQTNTVVAATAQRGAKHLGTEYGLTADWKHSENLKVGLGGSIYQAGGVVKQALGNLNAAGVSIGDNPATLLFADLSIKF